MDAKTTRKLWPATRLERYEREHARLKAAELEASRKLEAFEKAHQGTFQAAYPRIFDRWLEKVDALERFEREIEVL